MKPVEIEVTNDESIGTKIQKIMESEKQSQVLINNARRSLSY